MRFTYLIPKPLVQKLVFDRKIAALILDSVVQTAARVKIKP